MNPFFQSFRWLRRDARAGELHLLFAAVALAVLALGAVGALAERLDRALALQARELLGADRVLSSSRPIPEDWIREAERRGLRHAVTANFPAMLMQGDSPQLVSAKAVSADYPLRGQLRIAPHGGAQPEASTAAPRPGEAFGDPRLFEGLPEGATPIAGFGDIRLRLRAVLTREPDRGFSFVNLAPRLLVRLEDLEASQLIQPASRVTWRLLLAGDPKALDAFQSGVEAQSVPGLRIESPETARPELRSVLDRARAFLSVVALACVLMCAVAIGLAAGRFAQRHLDGYAVMRALGARRATLMTTLLLEMLWVAALAGVAGALAGLLLQEGLSVWMQGLLPFELPSASPMPLIRAVISGGLLLLLFAGATLAEAVGVPPLHVLRRERAALGRWARRALGLALAVMLLALWVMADWKLAAWSISGFALASLLFLAASWGVVSLLGRLRHHAVIQTRWPALAAACRAWARRRRSAVLQMSALATGLMALFLVVTLRIDLLEAWQARAAGDAPDRFVINIQPDQQDAVLAVLRELGVRDPQAVPMVRGRLIDINGRPAEDVVGPDNDRGQRLLERDFNLSYARELPEHNRVASGRWLNPEAPEVSVEKGVLRTLGLTVGDRLGFDIAGEEVQAVITGVRELEWTSMRVNFFMILSPALLADRPQTAMVAVRQPPQSPSIERALTARFANLTVFDISAIAQEIRVLLDQVSLAVQAVFLLTVLAGWMVLQAALLATRDERYFEAALMRALGATASQLRRALLIELTLGGGLAGLLAASCAQILSAVLCTQVLGFEGQVHVSLLILGALLGAGLGILGAWSALGGVLRASPMSSLRAAPGA